MKSQEHESTNAHTSFKSALKHKMDVYAHAVYTATKEFPREEQYGITSQFRRASVSVVLNYIEGYARKSVGYQLQFLQISYGSLKESEYLIDFSEKEGFINLEKAVQLKNAANEIGAMLWTELSALERANGK
ncbi:MAG: four helix bundle protein [Patescibacteria group bacterium]